MEEINYRLQNQSAPPIPTAIMAIKDPRNPSDINSWNQNVQILPEKVIINNSEPSGGVGSSNSNIRGTGITKTIMEEINYRLQSAQSAPPPPAIMARLQSAPQSAPQSGSPPPINMARFQSAPQSTPPPPMANRDNINSSPNSRDPRDINSWNQNVQILPEKAIISNSESTGVGMVGGGGVGNSNIRGAGKQKPYACTYCEKKFSHVHLMKQHVRIHTGEKPFACKYCEKRFTQSHSVKGGLISESFFNFCHFLKKMCLITHLIFFTLGQ